MVTGTGVYRADLLIEGERITHIGNLPKDRWQPTWHIEDVRGCFILPGTIDLHVHTRDPAKPPVYATRFSETRSALAGGITTILDMPNTHPPVTTPEVFEQKWQRWNRQPLWCNWALFPALIDDHLEEMLEWAQHDPRVPGLKIFLAPSTGGLVLHDWTHLNTVFQRYAGLLVVHAEDPRYFGEKPTYAWDYPKWRTRTACYRATQWLAHLYLQHRPDSASAAYTLPHVHILHVSTAEEVFLYRRLPSFVRQHFTLETCPHYLWFAAEDFYWLGKRLWCNPAIKQREDQQVLRYALANHLIYTVGSDHAPHPVESKTLKEEAPAGIPGVRTLLLILLEGVTRRWWTLTDVVQWTAEHPARLLRLSDRGVLRAGAFADLVIVDRHPTAGNTLSYTCGWHPYANYVFTWRIRTVWVNGQRAYHLGRWLVPAGKPLRFPKP